VFRKNRQSATDRATSEQGVDLSVLRSDGSRVMSAVVPCFLQASGPARKNTAPAGSSGTTTAKKQAQPPAVTGASLAKKVLANPNQVAATWDQIFLNDALSPSTIADAVTYLHQRQQYDVAVECMLSAIRNDRGVPWMYDILALEMKLAGWPKDEIARVLQSRLDFATSDIRQMLLTAALLSRFEAWTEAIAVCREATEISPELSEPWLLGRSIADKSRQLEAQVFFRCGILKYCWDSNFVLLHEEARKALTDLIDRCDREGLSDLGMQFREQLAAAAAVDLEIRLNWVGSADLDLIVTEPGGEKCSYKRRQTANGGRLVGEDGVAGPEVSKQSEIYVCHTALSGDYEIAVRFVLGKAVAGAATLEIIQHKGTQSEKRTTKTVTLAKEDVILKTTLLNGRATSK